MTTITPKALVAGQTLTASAVTYYTAPALKQAIIKSATVTNTTAGSVNLTIYRVPSGGSAGTANAVIYARPLVANETYNCPELVNKVLGAGDFIQALGLALSFDVSGAEVG